MNRWYLWLPILGMALSATPSVNAQRAWRPMPPPPPRQDVSVQLETEEGATLPTFLSGGQAFVLGSWGQRYNIRVSNLGPGRVEVVVAVDGRDAVSGQVTDLVRHRGYVIPGHGTLRVEGFRNSLESVAAFRFTDPSDGYSARMGTPQQQGMISVAVYPERTPTPGPIAMPDEPPWWRRGRGIDDAEQAPAPGAAPRQAEKRASPATGATRADQATAPWRERREPQGGNLGTQFGETRFSHVVEVDFERLRPTQPSQRITVRYDDAAGLEARGIQLGPRPQPHAFWPPLPVAPPPHREFAQPPPPPDPWLRWHPWEWPVD
jgi:hypothetical protein